MLDYIRCITPPTIVITLANFIELDESGNICMTRQDALTFLTEFISCLQRSIELFLSNSIRITFEMIFILLFHVPTHPKFLFCVIPITCCILFVSVICISGSIRKTNRSSMGKFPSCPAYLTCYQMSA